MEPKARLYIEGSWVEDAQYAVRAQDASSLHIQGNTFNRNFVGVYTTPSYDYLPQLISFPEGPMTDNDFLCTAGLLPGYTDQWPTVAAGDISFAGIEANDAVLDIGSSSGPESMANRFDGLRNGIWARRSVINSYNCLIKNMNYGLPGASTGYDAKGNGIFLEQSWATIIDNTIQDVSIGIQALASSLLAEDNTLLNNIDGINAAFAANRKIEILNNDITFLRTGTRILNIINPTLLSITDNTYAHATGLSFPSNDAEIAIAISSAVSGAGGSPASKRISNNTINIPRNGCVGISIGDFDFDVDVNTITINNLQQDGAGFSSYGIQLTGASGNYLYGNTVMGAIELDNSSIGLFAGGAASNTLCCNTFDNTGSGLFFWGMCDDTRLRHSSIGNHGTGLRCQYGTVIGDQVHAGNQWAGSYGGYPAVHWGTFDEILNSRFFVEPPDGTAIWPDGLHSPNNPDWFNTFPGSATGCGGDSGCTPPPLGEEELPVIDETDIRIAEAGFENPLYGPYLNWEGTRHLYQKLANYPSLLGQEGAMDDFFEGAGGTPIAAFYELDAGIAALYGSDAILTARQAALVIYLGQLEKLKAELAEATDEEAIAQFNAYIEITGGLLASNWQALLSLHQELEAQRIPAAKVLIQENAQVLEEGPLEANRKAVNDIFLSTAAQGFFSLDENQLIAVQGIAEQCPFEGGHAVYFARALYQLHEYRTFDDLALCEEPEQRSAPAGMRTVESTVAFRIYPNPSTGALNVAVPEAYVGQRLELRLSSLTGRLLASKEIAAANAIEHLENDQTPGGIYSVEVWAAGQRLATERLVIIK